MSVRENLRNVAIVAHVDHGKTTLVDAMLWQGGAFSERDTVEKTGERVMDSQDLEREKGITILAKNTAIHYRGPAAEKAGLKDGVIINVIDTPGHADFGGEVERGLSMVDGVVLLVDSSEGPLPQTRFVLRKALAKKLPVILVINKVDRPDARIDEVVSETTDLLLNLAEDLINDGQSIDVDQVLDFPIVYAASKAGRSSLEKPADGQIPDTDLEPLFETILKHIPGPVYEQGAPLQAQVTNLDASTFLGRLALLRIYNGTLSKGQVVGWVKTDGSVEKVKITQLMLTEGLERVNVEQALPGDIAVVAGIEQITIGESLVDPDNAHPLPMIKVDEPAISMIFGVNNAPTAGQTKGAKVTARQIKDRLDREMVGNVSLRVVSIDRPDAWEVQGRGELALAILVEQMRREGYELTAGKPRVVTKEIDGVRQEPMEQATIDSPEEYLGAITQLMAVRKGRLEHVANHGTGWVRMMFKVPARGLIGIRTQFLTQTHGTGIMSTLSAGYEPWQGEIVQRATGAMVADRAGQATSYAMKNLQDRGTFLIEPGQQVYEGQVVGENARPGDMIVNITKEKKQTNIRSATADAWEGLAASRKLTLEESIEFAADDECVEVTADSVRIRKVVLDTQERHKVAVRSKNGG